MSARGPRAAGRARRGRGAHARPRCDATFASSLLRRPRRPRPLPAAALAALWLSSTSAAHAQPDATTWRDQRAATAAQRDAGTWLDRPNPLRAFLPSAAARAAEQQARGEALLEKRLALLPGVRAVQVQLSLPHSEGAPLDRPLPPARAQVMLRADDARRPTGAEVARTVAEALPDLAPIEIALSRTPPPRPPAPAPSVRVGPFWVAPASALPLRIALAACLLSNIVLACLLLLRWRRRAPPRP